MISSRIEKILLTIIKLGIIIILFLPLLVYRPVLYPYVFSKILSFQVIVEIIFVIWLFLALYAGKKYRPDWKTPLVIALSLFMGILFLTSLTSVDFAKSFWSTQERMNGVITLLHFYVFFIVLISTFKNKKDWQRIIWASLICSFFVGMYGIGQKFGLEFLLKNSAIRMSATLGNPIFLGVYALLHVFLAGILFYFQKTKTGKIFIIFFLVFNISILFLTATRGALIAFGTSVVFGLIYFAFSKQSKRKVKILSLIMLLTIIGSSSFIYFNRSKEWINKMPQTVRRLTKIDLEKNKSRLISWQIGLQGFKEKPLLGYGWENYDIVFNKHYNPWYLNKGNQATWFDRSHNQVIDILALMGIFGILSYLAIFGIVFWLLFKKIKILDNLKQKIPFVLLGLMFLAYFVQNLFVFDTPAPLIVFYFSLALVYFLTKDSFKQVQPDQQVDHSKKSNFPLPVFILLILIFLPWAMYKFNIEPFQQSRLGVRAIQASKLDLKSSLYLYEQALAKPCFTNPEVRVYLAQAAAEQYPKISSETSQEDLSLITEATEMAIAEYKKSVQEHPLNARHWLYLGQLYNLGINYNAEYIEDAKETLKRALELSPKRQQIYYELGRVYFYEKNYELAINILKQAIVLDPQVKDAHEKLQAVLKILKEQEPELVEKTEQFLKELEN